MHGACYEQNSALATVGCKKSVPFTRGRFGEHKDVLQKRKAHVMKHGSYDDMPKEKKQKSMLNFLSLRPKTTK
eukprot:2083106-Ditylum_brightwellii.AAC.1